MDTPVEEVTDSVGEGCRGGKEPSLHHGTRARLPPVGSLVSMAPPAAEPSPGRSTSCISGSNSRTMAGPQVFEASKGTCTKSNTRFLVRVSPEVTVLREVSPITSWTATAVNIKCDIMACVSVLSDYIYRTQLKVFLTQDGVKLTSQLIAVFHHSLGRVTEKGKRLLFTLPFQ